MRIAIVIAAVIVVLLTAGLTWWFWPTEVENHYMGDKVVKSNADWRKILTDEQYHITREAGTERAGTGEYANCHDDGVYTCVCCGLPLFDSKTKFESGTGWPSFYDPITAENVAKRKDPRHFLATEVLCARCEAHLGHVFRDAPSQPTGLRYCINSAALKLVERESPAEKD